MTPVRSLDVCIGDQRVGELALAPRGAVYFAYDPQWLASGFPLSPLNMPFDASPQAAPNPLFGGLHGAFADSLPDGWGMLLMDRYFQHEYGIDRHRIQPLDRLAYLGDRAMGALEYRPPLAQQPTGPLALAPLYQAALQACEGDTATMLDALRLAGGSPGGARPKVVMALSADQQHCASPFAPLPDGHAHWLVKFRSQDDHRDTGAIEFAFARMAAAAGVQTAVPTLLPVETPTGTERFYAARRFDRDGDRKIHMLTASGILYADHRLPSLDYGDLLRATWVITKHAGEVEKMARLMVFNALAHNHDDHAKNFAFTCDNGCWQLAPAYDLTFSRMHGATDEHTTAFAGAGQPTRATLRAVCAPFPFLKVDRYIAQTLDALSEWQTLCRELDIAQAPAHTVAEAFRKVQAALD
ncbi:type II toxin-antitoxin system HipA family toxin [Thermomonas sp.]